MALDKTDSNFSASINTIYYKITDEGALNTIIALPLPDSATDDTFWDDAIYALADAAQAAGFDITDNIGHILKLASEAEPNNSFSFPSLPYPKP